MTTAVSIQDLARADLEHLIHPLYHPAAQEGAVIFERGEGVWLWDVNGKRYLDGLSCLWNVNIGHGRAELGEAAAAQMSRLAFANGYTGFSNVPAIELATRLAKLAPGDLNAVFFTSGGGDTIAAVIAEPIQGAGGVIIPPADYFRLLRELCDRHDFYLIADEVITGFGRTGTWFGMEQFGVQADMMSFAKGVTSGYHQLGGLVVSERIQAILASLPAELKWMHAYTYSGHPAACAVAMANLDIIEREGLG